MCYRRKKMERKAGVNFFTAAIRTGLIIVLVLGIIGWGIGLIIKGNSLFLGLIPGWNELALYAKIPLGIVLLVGIGAIINSLMRRDHHFLRKLTSIGRLSENLLSADVVMIEVFPERFFLGFTNGETLARPSHDLVPVFIPNTPVPFTGFTLLVEKKSVRQIDLTPKEALQILFSGGFVRDMFVRDM
jgi:hypothetical protein